MLSTATSLRSRGSAFFECTPKVQYPTSASDYQVLEVGLALGTFHTFQMEPSKHQIDDTRE
jgi:hypothetical protein